MIICPAASLQADRKQRSHQAEAHGAIKPQDVSPNPGRPDGYLSFSSIKVCFISNLIYISYKKTHNCADINDIITNYKVITNVSSWPVKNLIKYCFF